MHARDNESCRFDPRMLRAILGLAGQLCTLGRSAGRRFNSVSRRKNSRCQRSVARHFWVGFALAGLVFDAILDIEVTDTGKCNNMRP